MAVNRRQSMQLFAGAGAALTAATGEAKAQATATAAFPQGVASGDPDTESVVLWTRLATDAPQASVRWVIAADPELQTVVGEGEAMVTADRYHTVKVIADRLEPGTRYFYRFTAGDDHSPTGRTRTLPTGTVERLGIAIASCSNYPFGHFNAYDAMAKDEAVDLVLHTGDYIYEYGAGEWGDDTGQVLNRPHDPPHETVSLDDYRRRYAQYRSDPGLQAMHAAHPFIACWDDHETTNNPWMEGAGNHQPETEGEWAPRRDASMRAYFEWMPLREPEADQPLHAYWRTYRIGDLASLITLETRHTGRDEQPPYPDYDKFTSMEDRDRYVAEVLGDPDRRMLSPEVEAHVRSSLEASVGAGEPWRVVITASPIARFLVPDLVAGGIAEDAFPPAGRYLIDAGRWNLPWYSDTWDGYTAARESFYRLAREAGANDLLVLTGDTHNFFANELFDEAGERIGVEIGTTGISSPGEFMDAGFDEEVVRRIDALFAEGMNEVRWTDSMHQGYVRVELGREEADVTYVAVDTVLIPDYRAIELRKERIVKSGNSLAYG